MSACISNIVISHPKNVTTCEGEEVMFTCVLNTTITDHDVRWYRLRKGHGVIITVQIRPTRRINYTVVNETATILTIHNAAMSFIGFYWVKTPYFTGCNVSLNVLKGMCDNEVFLLRTYA